MTQVDHDTLSIGALEVLVVSRRHKDPVLSSVSVISSVGSGLKETARLGSCGKFWGVSYSLHMYIYIYHIYISYVHVCVFTNRMCSIITHIYIMYSIPKDLD